MPIPQGRELNKMLREVFGGAAGEGSGIITTVARVTVVWVQSLAQELPHAMDKAKKKKKSNKVMIAKCQIFHLGYHSALRNWSWSPGCCASHSVSRQ